MLLSINSVSKHNIPTESSSTADESDGATVHCYKYSPEAFLITWLYTGDSPFGKRHRFSFIRHGTKKASANLITGPKH